MTVTVTAAGCGSGSGGGRSAGDGGAAVGAAGTGGTGGVAVTSVAPDVPCPSGKPLSAGQGQSRDYVDLVRWQGRIYYAPASPPSDPPLDPARLGPVVATVRCSKSQHDSSRRSEPEWTDPGSTFVPDGGPLYAVTGVAAECQVAARSADGRLHLYTAQPEYRPANCPP